MFGCSSLDRIGDLLGVAPAYILEGSNLIFGNWRLDITDVAGSIPRNLLSIALIRGHILLQWAEQDFKPPESRCDSHAQRQ